MIPIQHCRDVPWRVSTCFDDIVFLPPLVINWKNSQNIEFYIYLCSVKVTFEQIYLKELYEQGKTSDKKHRFQPDIVKRYQQRIKTLVDAPRIETLYQIKSLNYEVLSGDKAGFLRLGSMTSTELSFWSILPKSHL